MGTKRAVNLSLDSDILDEAKAYGMNLSRAVDCLLGEAVREERERRWREENRAALEDFDRYIAENGIFGDEWRQL